MIAGQPNFLGLLEPMAEIGRLAHAAGALFVAVVEPVSLAVLAPPGEYGADIAPGEGQPLGIAPQYGGPYLGHPRLHGRARPPDPRPARRDDHRPRRQARVRHDDARARAGHPAREGGQQHLHEPGAARPRRERLPRAASARMGCATSPRSARRARPSSRPALAEVGIGRLHHGPYLNEFAIRVPDAPTVHRRLLDRGVLAGLVLAEAEPDDPTLADGLLVCATEVTTSDEIERFVAALSDVLVGRPPIAVEAGAGAAAGRSTAELAELGR